MKLADLVNMYISFKRSMGFRFRTQPRVLRRFCRFVGDIEADRVPPGSVETFLNGDGPVTNTWFLNYRLLQGLYRFAIGRGFVSCSPMPAGIPAPLPPFRPHIYSADELRALLKATSVLKSPRSPLQPVTFRTLLLVLYGTGLRVGEGLALAIRDVDLPDRLLTVRDTKFFKSRLVPIGPELAKELRAYFRLRSSLAMPRRGESAFFASSTGNALPYQHVITLFQRVRNAAGIQRDRGSSYPPRLHDLRHTAAVHRVVAWYREGADVQRLLPQLATYLGHKDLRSTQHYLTMTPDLLEAASRRFQHYAQAEGRDA